MHLTVVILTKDEELHIERAIASVADIACRIVVVDSKSCDSTVDLARKAGAEIITHDFVTQAKQFNWALEQLPEDTGWILRLDADEIVSPELAQEISTRLPLLGQDIAGVDLSRRIAFMGRPIRHGGVFPVRLVRLFRYGRGHSEDRWMDEHIVVDGRVAVFTGEILDYNLKTLSSWIDKHNSYASREVVEILDAELGVLGRATQNSLGGRQVGAKRWIKENVYARLPGGFRALAYFLYRYLFRLGFLDGVEGTAFHVLQGFWYRYLVDMKLHEVKTYVRLKEVDLATAIHEVLGIKIER